MNTHAASTSLIAIPARSNSRLVRFGKCNECDSPTFKFSEPSEAAKNSAREKFLSYDYPHDEWWDGVYEDAMRMGELIGIEISSTYSKGQAGREIRSIDISFSGFWSQGDGASFEGQYRYAPEAVGKISTETNDAELIRIAQKLALLQLTRRLLGLAPFSAQITRRSGSNYYSHSGTMRVEVNSEDENDEHSEVGDDLEDEVTQLMRDFADWIYERLEAEHDYLCSDEVVDECLSEETFDETGNEV